MREPPECKGCVMPICPINRWHCIVRLDLVLLKDLRKGGVSMDRLKKDLDHIKADGIDSGALYKRVCKYLSELVAYKATELTPETVVQLKQIAKIFNCDPADPAQLKSLCVKLREPAQAERDGRLVTLPFIAMVERSLLGGKMAPNKDQRFNGRYAVVYIDKKKWSTPLIDICGPHYDLTEVESRLAELVRPEAEAAVEQMKGDGAHE